jgi:hypothetical protein
MATTNDDAAALVDDLAAKARSLLLYGTSIPRKKTRMMEKKAIWKNAILMALGMTILGLAALPTVTPITSVPPEVYTLYKDTSRGIDQRTSKLSLR